MNVKSFMTLYIANYNLIKNKSRTFRYLHYLAKSEKIKKDKLKLGSVTFEMRPLIFNGVVFSYHFEMIFSQQTTINDKSKNIKKILNFFQWSWDFKNVSTLLIFLGFSYYSLYNAFYRFKHSCISGSLFDQEHISLILQTTFSNLDSRLGSLHSISNLSNTLVDLSMYFNLI